MKELNVNSILWTKDGRKVGNAIVQKYEGSIWTIKTDYGNILNLNIQEINELFYTNRDDWHVDEIKYMEEVLILEHKNYTKL